MAALTSESAVSKRKVRGKVDVEQQRANGSGLTLL